MAAELAVVQPQTQLQVNQPQTFAPRTLAEAIEFAKLIADSGMVPKDYAGKPGAIVVAIQLGYEVGLPPIQALQSIYTVNNRPALWGDGALAIIKTHPDFVSIHEDDPETIQKNSKATCIIKRRGQPDVRATFSQADATTAGLWKKSGPWTTAPFRMMQMRARAFAMRDQFPDALKGLKTVEEVRDYDGETVEGEKPTTSAATAKPAEEPTIGMTGGNDFFKIYANNGWTSDQSLEFLATIGIVKPRSSKDIPVKEWTAVPSSEWAKGGEIPGGAAWKWATSPSPIKAEVTRKFELLEFTPDERREFFKANAGEKKAEMYVNVDKALSAELDKRAEADQ